MLAANNEHITSAARSMYKKELDEATLRLCRKTDEEITGEEYRIKRLAQLEAENAEQATTINDQATIIEQLKKELSLLKGK